MTTNIRITTESDPAFIVKVFASRFQRLNNNDKGKNQLLSLNGCFAFSFTDGQSLSIRAQRITNGLKEIHLIRGVASWARLVFYIDNNKPESRPSIKGLLRHPLLALKVGNIMDDSQINLKDAATEFWALACSRLAKEFDEEYGKSELNGFPHSLMIRTSDTGKQIILPENVVPDDTEMTVEGSEKCMIDLFTGSSILVQEALTGKIKVNGSTRQIAEFSRINLALMTDINSLLRQP